MGKTTAASRGPTRGETVIQEFANSTSTPRESGRKAASLLSSKELLEDIRRLTPEDQMKFVDKIDRVRRDRLSFPLVIFPSLLLSRHTQPPTRELQNS